MISTNLRLAKSVSQRNNYHRPDQLRLLDTSFLSFLFIGLGRIGAPFVGAPIFFIGGGTKNIPLILYQILGPLSSVKFCLCMRKRMRKRIGRNFRNSLRMRRIGPGYEKKPYRRVGGDYRQLWPVRYYLHYVIICGCYIMDYV